MPTVLPITIQRRCCSTWCWAAVLSSITQGISTPCGKLPQGQLVTQVLNLGVDCSACCPNGNPVLDRTCNLPADISFALQRLGLGFTQGQPVSMISFDQIAQELTANRPVVAEIEFDVPPGGTHALLIYGFADPDLIRIGDPATGESMVVSFSAYCTPDAYNTGPDGIRGTWTNAYFLDGL
jgi:Papain-like cysteine protease AvrRpt2